MFGSRLRVSVKESSHLSECLSPLPTTIVNDNEDQYDKIDGLDVSDIASEHPGTETSEAPFHMVADPARPACSPSMTRAGADDVDPFSTSPLGPTSSTSPITSAQLLEHHWYGAPRSHRPCPKTSPSSSRRTSAGASEGT